MTTLLVAGLEAGAEGDGDAFSNGVRAVCIERKHISIIIQIR